MSFISLPTASSTRWGCQVKPCRHLRANDNGTDRGSGRSGWCQLDQPPLRIAAILQHVNGTVGTLLDFADARAHIPLVALGGIGAVQVDTDQRLARQAADKV